MPSSHVLSHKHSAIITCNTATPLDLYVKTICNMHASLGTQMARYLHASPNSICLCLYGNPCWQKLQELLIDMIGFSYSLHCTCTVCLLACTDTGTDLGMQPAGNAAYLFCALFDEELRYQVSLAC